MRGSIRRRGKNSWEVVIELPRDPETGKRRRKWVTVQGTRKAAEAELARLLVEAHGGAVGKAPARLTLGDYLDRWIEAVEPELKPSTVATYRVKVKKWKQTPLAEVPLAKLTPADVQRALAGFFRESAPKTVREMYNVLRAALRRAVEWGLLAKNPAEGVKVPRKETRELQVWTEEEATRFLEVAKKSGYYPVFVLALTTGMRLGELLGLKWEDVDLDAGYLQVKRTLADKSAMGKGRVVFQTPKTRAARRKIPLDPATVEVLRKHKKKQAEARLKKGPEWQDYDLVFCTSQGTPFYHSDVRKAFNRLVKKAGVKPIRFHDLRHTHATLLLRKGIHPKVVAERLGHSSVSITLDTYSHVLPDTQREAVRVLEELFRTKGSGNRR
ncbi:tyrosine-type recombinase/integrase [Desulfovirgula thermocuniculi]|uniref:tyrosine-type recombinase/integrase n=1 Tax=Desulfovirgula thermocuniculi TaxID=348842 RepID=UPI0004852FB7|nr:tyrosine-type recombinase/integrase [Desulfovirgula thermocuniculi]